MKLSRREFFAALAAGAVVVTAEGLWYPGRKVISIPKANGWWGFDGWEYNEAEKLLRQIGPVRPVSMSDLASWLSKAVHQHGLALNYDVLSPEWSEWGITDLVLRDGVQVEHPEESFNSRGSLVQAGQRYAGVRSIRHMPTDDSVRFEINGRPAARPGPVDQLVPVAHGGKIQVRDRSRRLFGNAYAPDPYYNGVLTTVPMEEI